MFCNLEKNKIISFSAYWSKSRKNSKADVLMASGDEHICVTSPADLSVIQHFFSSKSESPQRSTASTQSEFLCARLFVFYLQYLFDTFDHVCVCLASISEQEGRRGCPSRFPTWGERKNSRDFTETPNSLTENSKR